MLKYQDNEICDLLNFGFPVGYFVDVQQQEFTSLKFVKKNMKVQRTSLLKFKST